MYNHHVHCDINNIYGQVSIAILNDGYPAKIPQSTAQTLGKTRTVHATVVIQLLRGKGLPPVSPSSPVKPAVSWTDCEVCGWWFSRCCSHLLKKPFVRHGCPWNCSIIESLQTKNHKPCRYMERNIIGKYHFMQLSKIRYDYPKMPVFNNWFITMEVSTNRVTPSSHRIFIWFSPTKAIPPFGGYLHDYGKPHFSTDRRLTFKASSKRSFFTPGMPADFLQQGRTWQIIANYQPNV